MTLTGFNKIGKLDLGKNTEQLSQEKWDFYTVPHTSSILRVITILLGREMIYENIYLSIYDGLYKYCADITSGRYY